MPLLLGYLAAFLGRRRSRLRATFALALPLFAVEIALTYRYNVWLGRFMIMPVALGAALFARVYAARILSGFFAFTGIVFLVFALAHNERKPVGFHGTKPVWSLDRTASEALVLPGSDPIFRAIATLVPEHARVGVRLGEDDFDYPLYGTHLARRLVELPRRDPLAAASRRRLDWVVVGNVRARLDRGWTRLRLPGNWSLLAPTGTAEARALERYVAAGMFPNRPDAIDRNWT